MTYWQSLFLILFALVNFLLLIKGLYESKHCHNAYGLTRPLICLGIFVWGDAVILSGFWLLVALISLTLQDWYLFLLLIALFWLVRSIGETVYWLNQQFSVLDRNPPRTLFGNKIFHNDSIWFVHQIFWQCVTVFALLGTIYLSWQWLQQLSA